jgi:hypothetical protein
MHTPNDKSNIPLYSIELWNAHKQTLLAANYIKWRVILDLMKL